MGDELLGGDRYLVIRHGVERVDDEECRCGADIELGTTSRAPGPAAAGDPRGEHDRKDAAMIAGLTRHGPHGDAASSSRLSPAVSGPNRGAQ